MPPIDDPSRGETASADPDEPPDPRHPPLAVASSHAERARTLLARASHAALATIAREPAGSPFATRVDIADDFDGAPLLLVSSLAEHSQNLLANPAASVLVWDSSRPDEPSLSLGRVTIVGRVETIPDAERAALLERYLSRNAHARGYATFRDFTLLRLRIEAVRFVGGFGSMSWVDTEDYRQAEPEPPGRDHPRHESVK